jgi:hypothetical protein
VVGLKLGFSAIFGDFRRFSVIFGDFRRFVWGTAIQTFVWGPGIVKWVSLGDRLETTDRKIKLRRP